MSWTDRSGEGIEPPRPAICSLAEIFAEWYLTAPSQRERTRRYLAIRRMFVDRLLVPNLPISEILREEHVSRSTFYHQINSAEEQIRLGMSPKN